MESGEYDVYKMNGLGREMSWLSDKPSPDFSEVYNRFIENGFVGVLTKEEAIEAYKDQSGMDPQFVTECPVIEAIHSARIKAQEICDVPESFLNQKYPYEPALKYMY